jgi:hypothetical protein
MRNSSRTLNHETHIATRVDLMMSAVGWQGLLASLSGVTVYVLGADAAGNQISEWESLKQFWTVYFQNAGATLLGYSILFYPPSLKP